MTPTLDKQVLEAKDQIDKALGALLNCPKRRTEKSDASGAQSGSFSGSGSCERPTGQCI